MNLGLGEIAVIILVGLLIFGPNQLPKIGKTAGKTMYQFKKGWKEMMDDEENK
ncbi:twin-arginine translocase TatA/TatE family subunit [Aeribacillus pallidus]|jgi:sec-independent protein translocase protein TatA|uniref:twin-arginine translocase TatA/TatE family subunit n=1 Tax=Aeribacillus pallidus TaxID=33936 RepID=UPI003D2581A0